MPPAGRPRSSANRDLAPGVYRRVRGGRARYYDASGRLLGTDPSEAARALLDRRAEAVQAAIGSWRAASDSFSRYLDSRHCTLAPKTRANYANGIKTLNRVFGSALMRQITPASIGAIKRRMVNKPVAFNRLRALIGVVWKHAHEEGLTRAPSPVTSIRGYSERRHRPAVEDAQVAAIARHGDQVLRDWIALSLAAGQRVSDTLLLTRAHVVGDELRPPNSKTGYPIRIALDGDLGEVVRELLTRPREISGSHLIQHRGRRVTYAMIRKRWDAAQRMAQAEALAGGQEWHWITRRDLRSKSATDAQDGASDRLGHQDERTTRKHYRRRARLSAGGIVPAGILANRDD